MADKQATEKRERVCLGVYIPKALHSELAELAKRKEIPMSQIVRETLKEYVQKERSTQ